MKKLLFASAISWLMIVGACTNNCDQTYSEEGYDESCDVCTEPPDDCNGLIPDTSPLAIHLSEPLPVLVRVYSGKAYETGTLVYQKVPTSKDFSVELPLGHYSVTALYVNGTDSTLAIDGVGLDYRALETCDRDCYVPEGGDVDLKRK